MAMRIARDSSTLKSFKLAAEPLGSERREHRRYELGGQTLQVDKWDGKRREAHVDAPYCPVCPTRLQDAGFARSTPAKN